VLITAAVTAAQVSGTAAGCHAGTVRACTATSNAASGSTANTQPPAIRWTVETNPGVVPGVWVGKSATSTSAAAALEKSRAGTRAEGRPARCSPVASATQATARPIAAAPSSA
jgi:hypothetical protein